MYVGGSQLEQSDGGNQDFQGHALTHARDRVHYVIVYFTSLCLRVENMPDIGFLFSTMHNVHKLQV